MTNRLYIIGNGFDLHHGLATTYYDFAKYLNKNNSRLFDTLKRYILYPTLENDLWSNFEMNLAYLDIEWILSDNSNFLPDYESESYRERDRYAFPDEMHQIYESLTDELFEAFREFILDVIFPPSACAFTIEIDMSAKFLTFNYTDTLERLYKIDRDKIVYIHNAASDIHHKLFLGHGIEPANFLEDTPDPPDDIGVEEIEKWFEQNSGSKYEYSYGEGKETLERYFYDTYKPTKEIIDRHNAFFKNLSDINEVFILGHSISEVDLPYFEHIIKSVPKNAKWNISFYGVHEKERHLEKIKLLGIDEIMVKMFEMIEIQQSNKQLKIIFPS